MAARLQLAPADKELLARLYHEAGVTADKLPYSDSFDNMHEQFCKDTGIVATKQDFWITLSGLRKAGGLTRLVMKPKAESVAVETPEQANGIEVTGSITTLEH